MYVKRLKLYGVRGFRLDLPLNGQGDLSPATRKRLLLQGGNGSGKSTVIETIAGLWDCFGKMIDDDASSPPFAEALRWSAELNAMELGDYPAPGATFWIAVGTFAGIDALKKAHPGTPMASMQLSGEQYSQHYRIALPPGDWETVKIRSQEGVEPMPNVVHFPPDGRSVLHAPPGGVKRLDLYRPNWLATYDAQYDLDSLLFTVRAVQPQHYDAALELFNRLLLPEGKRVSAQQDRQGRLQIERIGEPNQPAHPWTALSSGERQMLLLFVYTVCLLRDDSILLIDEPDLHIHIGMVAQVMETLEHVVRKHKGQLIVASHSQLVWDWFARDEERIQLS